MVIAMHQNTLCQDKVLDDPVNCQIHQAAERALIEFPRLDVYLLLPSAMRQSFQDGLVELVERLVASIAKTMLDTDYPRYIEPAEEVEQFCQLLRRIEDRARAGGVPSSLQSMTIKGCFPCSDPYMSFSVLAQDKKGEIVAISVDTEM